MKVGQLAKVTEVNVETIRYYQRLGLLEIPDTPPGTVRHYDGNHARRLRFICRAKNLGFTLEEIASLLSLTGPDCEDVQALATRKLDLVREKVADLKQIEAALVKGVQNCQTRGQPNTCPLLESFTKNG